LTYIRKDGSRFPAVVSVTALRDAQDKIIGYLLIGTDNTARKKAETALRESDVNFRTMVEAVPQMVWITRADGFNIYFSQKWMDYTGLTLEETMGHGWIKPFHPEDQQRAWEAWQQATQTTGATYRVECRLRRADGAYRWFLILGVRQLDFDGSTLKWFGTCTDITLAKLSEVELKAANQELQQFAYVASHDLQAPLRAIHNSAKWLEEDLEEHLTDETREHLNVLRGRVKRMEKLLDDLLEYARIGRARDSRYDETIKGDRLMEDVLALLSVEGFTVEISPALANIEVRLMPLQQIFMNLIGNAIKHHNKKTGKISVTVEDDGDFYAFAVKDDGPGIGAQFHEQVFEMFRTLRPRDQVEGSGMGLAMVRKHIEVGGGTLRLESALGQGSTFHFTWPKRQQPRKEIA
jgi:PAS domain S-box-containing protein